MPNKGKKAVQQENVSTPTLSQKSPAMVNLTKRLEKLDDSENNTIDIDVDDISKEVMLTTILALQKEVSTLSKRVDNLEHNLVIANSQIAISSQTSTLLKNELDNAEQYSRRSCIVVNGVPATNDKNFDHVGNIKTILEKSAPEVTTSSIDKAHPVGPVINGKQSIIVKFSKHSTVKSLYMKRRQIKKDSLVSLQPSLTRQRSKTLKSLKEKISKEGTIFNKLVNFIFADIEGNLKACLKNPLRGRNIHTFTNEDHLAYIIHDLNYERFDAPM